MGPPPFPVVIRFVAATQEGVAASAGQRRQPQGGLTAAAQLSPNGFGFKAARSPVTLAVADLAFWLLGDYRGSCTPAFAVFRARRPGEGCVGNHCLPICLGRTFWIPLFVVLRVRRWCREALATWKAALRRCGTMGFEIAGAAARAAGRSAAEPEPRCAAQPLVTERLTGSSTWGCLRQTRSPTCARSLALIRSSLPIR
jgi:hypothetical protein